MPSELGKNELVHVSIRFAFGSETGVKLGNAEKLELSLVEHQKQIYFKMQKSFLLGRSYNIHGVCLDSSATRRLNAIADAILEGRVTESGSYETFSAEISGNIDRVDRRGKFMFGEPIIPTQRPTFIDTPCEYPYNDRKENIVPI